MDFRSPFVRSLAIALAIATVMVGVSAYRAKMRAHQAELAKSAAACGTRLAGDTAGATLAKASVNCEQR